jgi:hypothetical protein
VKCYGRLSHPLMFQNVCLEVISLRHFTEGTPKLPGFKISALTSELPHAPRSRPHRNGELHFFNCLLLSYRNKTVTVSSGDTRSQIPERATQVHNGCCITSNWQFSIVVMRGCKPLVPRHLDHRNEAHLQTSTHSRHPNVTTRPRIPEKGPMFFQLQKAHSPKL